MYHNEVILLDATCADPQAVGHVHAGNADADRNWSAASESEARKHRHYTRPEQVFFDERSDKLATLAVERFGHLDEEGSDLIDDVAASIVGEVDGSSLARKGVGKEPHFHVFSVITQVET